MSRVGKNEVVAPQGVTLTLNDRTVSVKGQLGQADYQIPDQIEIEKTEAGIKFSPSQSSKQARMLWGTTQRNIANIVKGVTEGFNVTLKLNGVGYKASVAGQKLTLQLGYSHDIVYDIPNGIAIKANSPTELVVSGADKQQVGQVAAILKSYRPVEPYKGKGVIRQGDYVLRKEGKKK